MGLGNQPSSKGNKTPPALKDVGQMGAGMKRVLRIRQYIGERCMTQTEAAAKCGLKPQAFSRIVNGLEPPYSKRGQRIADALGWEGDYRELFMEVAVDD